MRTGATDGSAIAPGSIVIVRDAEWLVLAMEETKSGLLVKAQGLSELVRGATASFYSDFDEIVALDPAQARIKSDDSPGYRRTKLWLEATIRKTPLPLGGPELSVSTQMLVDTLGAQRLGSRHVGTDRSCAADALVGWCDLPQPRQRLCADVGGDGP